MTKRRPTALGWRTCSLAAVWLLCSCSRSSPEVCFAHADCGPCERCDNGSCNSDTASLSCRPEASVPDASAETGTQTASLGDTEPVQPTGSGTEPSVPLRVVSVAAGDDHTCVMLEGGGVRCFGRGQYGRLGYGNEENLGDDEAAARLPDIRFGDEEVVGIAAGGRHTCALVRDGGIYCFGDGEQGQLGRGRAQTVGDDETPDDAGDAGIDELGAKVLRVALGDSHTCAILEGSVVRCFGLGDDGRLGNGSEETIGDDERPSSVSPIDFGWSVEQIAAGGKETCAVSWLGQLKCTGDGLYGQLGSGSAKPIGSTPESEPDEVDDVDLPGRTLAAAVGRWHACAIVESGDLYCFGRGELGALGYGNTENIGDDEPPSDAGPVDLGGKVLAVDVGARHTCAILEGGILRCFGHNGYGQLGLGHTEAIGDDELPSAAPPIDFGERVTAVGAGGDHTCALLEDARLVCFGRNDFGQLGYGHTDAIGDDEPLASVEPIAFTAAED